MTSNVPSLGGLPIVGRLPAFLRDPFAVLERSMAVGEVSRLDLGLLEAVLVHHPDHVDHVLRTHRSIYVKEGPHWDAIRSLVGEGLTASQGSLWLRQRRMMQPHFHRRRLEGLTDVIVDAIQRSLTWTDIGSEWQTIDIGARMPYLTMNVVSASIFGSETSKEDADVVSAELRWAIDHMFRGILADKLPRWIPFPGRGRFRQSVDRMRETVRGFIEAHRKGPGSQDNLLAMMLAATDDETGMGMSDEQVLAETLSLFLAGSETTGSALLGALHYVVEDPEILGRLREESDAVLRGDAPTFADVRRLRYASWVMHEALRLRPPAWWIPRYASEDDEIAGFSIPAGTIVAPVTHTIHRHPAFWSEPDRFEPERFEPGRVAARHPFAWFPFGAGQHQCIGQQLALMESTFALAMIVQRYELRSVGHVTRPHLSTVVKTANGVRVAVRRRPGRRRRVNESSSAIMRRVTDAASSEMSVVP